MQQVDAERRSLAFRALPVKYNFSEADTDTFTTLPDLGFDVLPFVSESWLSDLAVVLLVVLTQIRFSLTPMGATIVRRWVFLLGSLFVLRGVSIVITMLPNPLKNCRSTALDYHPAVASLMIISGQVVTCGDVLFSGHTVNLTLAALVWQTYSHKAGVQLCKPNLCPTCFDPIGAIFCKDTPVENDAGHLVRATTAKIFIWICAIVGMLTIIATRFHYSIDVFIGFCLCLLLWKLYHYYLITIYIDCEKWHNRVLGWLERDSEEFSVDKQLVEEGMTALQAIAGGPAETVSDVDTVALQIDQ